MMAEDFGKLLLRLNLGALLLFQGVHKLLNGLDPIKEGLARYNIPDVLTYGVYLGELVAPLLIIFGLFSRVGGILVAINVLITIVLVHPEAFPLLKPETGGFALELEALYLFGGVCVALLGAGRIAIGPKHWN
jgi:putative oxidoreductase